VAGEAQRVPDGDGERECKCEFECECERRVAELHPPTPPYQGGETGVTVSAGSIDTSALAPGRYVLLMHPTGAAVLRTDVALNTDLAGNFAVTARAVTGVGAIAFEIAK
jgi:hypothetical protein